MSVEITSSQTGYTGRPSPVFKVPAQSVLKLPDSINSGLDGNKTLHMTSNLNTGKRYKRETTLKFSEGSVETYESFRSQFNIHRKMLGLDDYRTVVELYMSLEGKATLKVEEVVEHADSTGNVSDMWEVLDCAFFSIDHSESKYRRFATRCMIQGESMTEYLDELICLSRKAKPGTIVQFLDEYVKKHLLNWLPSEILNEIQ